jgi:hypothetical protein
MAWHVVSSEQRLRSVEPAIEQYAKKRGRFDRMRLASRFHQTRRGKRPPSAVDRASDNKV